MSLVLPALHGCRLPGVRVAWADLEDPDQPPSDVLASGLSREERERAGRFRFERDRRRFLVAHALLRGLLARTLALDPAAVELTLDRFGKPRLEGAGAGLGFNLSHTGARALYAVAHGLELGVDAEAVRPLLDMQRLARDVFSAEELAEWERLPEPQRAEGFFNGWTRKEAVLKALGRGLDYPLAAFTVSLAPEREALLLRAPDHDGPDADWSMHAFSPEPGYVAAVVARRHTGR